MLVAFSVAPSGSRSGSAPDRAESADASVHDAVAAAVARRARLRPRAPHHEHVHRDRGPDWDTVMDVVKRATEAVMPFGSRVSLVLKADIRPGYSGEIDGKIERLERGDRRGRGVADGRRRRPPLDSTHAARRR